MKTLLIVDPIFCGLSASCAVACHNMMPEFLSGKLHPEQMCVKFFFLI
jgi:hypothetical protein